MNKFWLNDLTILFSKNKLIEVIPYSNLNFNDKLNTVFRLSIYFSFIMLVIKKDYRYLSIAVIIGILTVIIYKNSHKLNIESNNPIDIINKDSNINEEADGCRLPTAKNPFMNPTFSDYENGKLLKSCNSYDNTVIRDMENEYFNNGLYRDQTDIFNKNNSQREFYTMPVNSIMNDSVKFAEWCYKTPPTCREGNSTQCFADLQSAGQRP